MIQVIEWRPANRKTFQGHFDIIIPKWGGFIICDMRYFKKDNKRWISFPSKKFEKDGKIGYYNYCKFHAACVNKLFNEKVLDALDQFFQEQKI